MASYSSSSLSAMEAYLSSFVPSVEPTLMARIYPNEMDTGNRIVQTFREGQFRWAVLEAQPQSGKTHSYFFAIAEMFRGGHISKATVFSGNAEKDLVNQLIQTRDKEFFPLYKKFLMETLRETELRANGTCQFIQERIDIIWSSNLETYEPNSNTMFVWDESHFAQNKEMRPDKFLQKWGIFPDIHLSKNHSFVLSVSATPFSEICDMVHLQQPKAVIRMVPGDGYYGIKQLLHTNKIRSFENWSDALRGALQTETERSSSPKWAIVRTAITKDAEAKDLIRRSGWAIKEYNCNAKDIGNPEELKHAPDVNTVLLIKGMLRMGKRLEKKHLSFVMETSATSWSDVVIQGLLGRLCGYNGNPDTLMYLHQRILERRDLERYVLQMDEGAHIMVKKARNLVSANEFTKNGRPLRHTNLNEIIPLHISLLHSRTMDGSMEINPCDMDKTTLVYKIKDVVSGGRMREGENLNEGEQRDEIIQQIRTYQERQFKIHNIKTTTSSYSLVVPKKIHQSRTNRTPMKLGSSAGINPDGGEIIVWRFHQAFPQYGIRRGDLFVDARTVSGSSNRRLENSHIPMTTKKEVFCRVLPTTTNNR